MWVFTIIFLLYNCFNEDRGGQADSAECLCCLISASHPNLQYVADFAPELGMIIMETKYLEQLGFQVPELARNVALQVLHGHQTKVLSLPSCCYNLCLY